MKSYPKKSMMLRGNMNLIALLALCVMTLNGTPIFAQPICDPAMPCSIQIDDVPLQKVPTLFKFQARISQAKIPVGDAVFPLLIVNIGDGVTTLCTENFSEVKVRNSVLNLEIGHNITCDLEQIIASHPALQIQVCIGNTENCLKPIAISSIPYAVKSTYAVTAQEAHHANVSAQSHYAHRVTADKDLFISNQLGTGYFDFYTPVSGEKGLLSELYNGTSVPTGTGGYVQWTPIVNDDYTLHVCGKDHDTGALKPLMDLMLHSQNTTMFGNAEIKQNAMIGGNAEVKLNATIDGNAVCKQNVSILGNVEVKQNTTVDGNAVIGQNVIISGDVDIAGQLSVGSMTAADLTLAPNTVNTLHIRDGGVKTADLGDNAVTSVKIADGAVGTADLADNAVTSAKIPDYVITGTKIANVTIGSEKIMDNAITNSKIANGSIGLEDLGSYSVNSAKIVDGSIALADLADSSVNSAKILDGSIVTADLANSSVNSAKIADGTIVTADLADGAITTAKIFSNSITNSHLQDKSVNNQKLIITSTDVYAASAVTGQTNTVDIGAHNFCVLTQISGYSTSNSIANLDGCEVRPQYYPSYAGTWYLTAKIGSQSGTIVCGATCF